MPQLHFGFTPGLRFRTLFSNHVSLTGNHDTIASRKSSPGFAGNRKSSGDCSAKSQPSQPHLAWTTGFIPPQPAWGTPFFYAFQDLCPFLQGRRERLQRWQHNFGFSHRHPNPYFQTTCCPRPTAIGTGAPHVRFVTPTEARFGTSRRQILKQPNEDILGNPEKGYVTPTKLQETFLIFPFCYFFDITLGGCQIKVSLAWVGGSLGTPNAAEMHNPHTAN